MIVVRVWDEDCPDEDAQELRIGDGPAGYVVTTGPGCEVTNEQRYRNGTVVLTIKPTDRKRHPDHDPGRHW